ncbi:hypothetical protein [Mycolicibacterium fluoranthenivorans]|jgi:hypothetical protein|uniref:PASTA domain-containing protein n=1 Tax=Mycolicibacterium fluoranthenivorans TaxID=258505 RepID=A0A1G4WGM9_9MYCO|nr:hypothetical protein [Mycolicibacterium fluoranthenivorans]SCX22052.1 hypothetical protein SAMN02799620_03172 [Mycolicibacterium fluoranthenivorans]
MKRLALGVGLAAVTAGVVVAISTGSAAAAGTDVTGQKFSDASSTLSGAGYTVIVGTTFGDEQGRDDCVVVNAVPRTVPAPENSSGSATKEMVVSLNCDSGAASNKSAGYSMGSPEGRAAKAAEESAAAKASAEASPASGGQ